MNLLIRLFEWLTFVSKLSTWDKNQHLGKVKHIQELAKISQEFVSSKCFMLVGGGWHIDQLLTVSREATNIQQESAVTFRPSVYHG